LEGNERVIVIVVQVYLDAIKTLLVIPEQLSNEYTWTPSDGPLTADEAWKKQR